LTWIAQRRAANGTWDSTQATVLALKALLAATVPQPDSRRDVEVLLDRQVVERIQIPADQFEVVAQVDISDKIKTGEQRLELRDRAANPPAFQVAYRYNLPGAAEKLPEPLKVELGFDREQMLVGEALAGRVTVTNQMPVTAPMVMLDLPVPPGFSVRAEDFDTLVRDQRIARYQVTPRQVIVYLRSLEAGRPLQFSYRVEAGIEANVAIGAARVYEYYDPAKVGTTRTGRIVVTQPKRP
jgi:hypothetical protein